MSGQSNQGQQGQLGPRKEHLGGLSGKQSGEGGLLQRFGGKEKTPTYTEVRFTPEPFHSERLYDLFARLGTPIPEQYVTRGVDGSETAIQVSIPVTELSQLIRTSTDRLRSEPETFELVVGGIRSIVEETVTQDGLAQSFARYQAQRDEGRLAAREEWERGAERHMHNIFSALELERFGQMTDIPLTISDEKKRQCGMDDPDAIRAAAKLLDIFFVETTFTTSLSSALQQVEGFGLMLPPDEEAVMETITQITGAGGAGTIRVEQAQALIAKMRADLQQAVSPETYRELYGDPSTPDVPVPNFQSAPTGTHNIIRPGQQPPREFWEDAPTQPAMRAMPRPQLPGGIPDEVDYSLADQETVGWSQGGENQGSAPKKDVDEDDGPRRRGW